MSEGRDLSLTREQIIGLLAELGQELDALGIKAQLFVVRGAAIYIAVLFFPIALAASIWPRSIAVFSASRTFGLSKGGFATFMPTRV